ncbi:hypothetical protein ACKVMT_09315 [Halobacteriales archaeon Cl-PHB]
MTTVVPLGELDALGDDVLDSVTDDHFESRDALETDPFNVTRVEGEPGRSEDGG